jgi:HD-GYP domain-containing protein (c-di-GMP phosphodiesterase class II)
LRREADATGGYAALVLDRLARQTCQVLESVASSIFARDPHMPGTSIAVAGCGAHEDLIGSRFRDVNGLAGPGALTRAVAPAIWDGVVHGTLAAEPAAGRCFGDPELEVLGELAETAGAALEHAERRGEALRAARDRVGELIGAIGEHDGYTAGHSEAVVTWSCAVGERLHLSLPDLLELELGALLHDLGKVRVPGGILRKPAPLEQHELRMVRLHPVWGAEMLADVPGFEPVATIVRFHHERWDGTGYPDGLERDRIPIASRIVAVCDAYEAMTSDRPYRGALPPGAAASELCARAGTQFDPAVVECFVEVLMEWGWPLGAGMAAEAEAIEGAR